MRKKAARDKILHYFAFTCYQQGLWQKAIATYQHLVMHNPGCGIYWYGLGSSLMMSGNDEDAAHAFQIACVHSKNDPRPHAYWAECSSRLGRLEIADSAIKQAEKLSVGEKFAPFLERVQVIKERIVEVVHGR